MVTMNSEEKFNQAYLCRESKDYEKAIGLYKELLDDNEYNRFEVLIQIGGTCYFSGNYTAAYNYYRLALAIESNEEIASLGFYLACSKLDKLREGLLEMQRFLKDNPASLYKDTINELISGLDNGYATDFTDIITGFRKYLI